MKSESRGTFFSNPVFLGVYQIAGSCTGGWLLWNYLADSNPDQQQAAFLIPVIVFLLFYGFGIYCGIACLRDQKNAFHLSRINQYLQVCDIRSYYFSYKFLAGVGVMAGIDFTDGIRISVDFTSPGVLFKPGDTTGPHTIYVNLMALAFIIALTAAIQRNQKKEKQAKD